MLAGWVEKHKARTPGNRALQQQLDEWMEEWDASEKQRQDNAAAAATDEGWTVVTKQRVSLMHKICRVSVSSCLLGRAQAFAVFYRAEERALTRVAHQLALWRQL